MTKRFALSTAVVAAALAVPAFAAFTSGLKPGESVVPFHPKHIAGPLAGTTNCFPCTFQNRPQVQAWFNNDNTKNIQTVAVALDKAMDAHKSQEFKAMVVLLTDTAHESATEASARQLVKSANLKNVDVAVLNKTNVAVGDYHVNTSADVKNTIFAYRNWKVAKTFVNLNATGAGKTELTSAINTVIK